MKTCYLGLGVVFWLAGMPAVHAEAIFASSFEVTEFPADAWWRVENVHPMEAQYADSGSPELAVLDADEDGDLDVLMARLLYPGVPVQLMRNDGGGTFTEAAATIITGGVPMTTHPREIVSADFNGDGRIDLFIADHGLDAPPYPGGQNRLLLSVPGGLANASSQLPPLMDFTHTAAAFDFDEDGDMDILVGNTHGGSAPPDGTYFPYVLTNDGNGSFTRNDELLPQDYVAEGGNKATKVLFVDADGDGHGDLFLGSHGESDTSPSRLLLNPGNGDFSQATVVAIPGGPFPQSIAAVIDAVIADLDGNALPDLLVLSATNHYEGYYVQTLINAGAGVFRDETAQRMPQDQVYGGRTFNRLLHVDLNRDGLLDLVANGNLAEPVWMARPGGRFVEWGKSFDFGGWDPWNVGLQVFDVDGDGHMDVFANRSSAETSVLVSSPP